MAWTTGSFAVTRWRPCFVDQRIDVAGLQEAFRDQIDDLAKRLPQFAWYGVGATTANRRGSFARFFSARIGSHSSSKVRSGCPSIRKKLEQGLGRGAAAGGELGQTPR